MPAGATRSSGLQFDRAAATLAALVIVGLAVFLLVRNEPISDQRLFFIMRVVVSFSVALLGATIPGFLNVGWSGSGFVIRAGGALALFVLTYVFTPDLVRPEGPETVINQTSTGPGSPPIVGNNGNINIEVAPKSN